MRDPRPHLQEALKDTYRIERELPGGGMGRVYLATELALDRTVVIKVLPGEALEDVSATRFRREIQVAAKLQHPLIVPLLAAGQAGQLLYYTMPWVDGESLRARLDRAGALSPGDVEAVVRDVLSALAYAHGQGIVHRDIKPENIMFSGGHAVVLDFGVARALAGPSGPHEAVTTAGMVVGTPAYMAPEQAAGDPATDHRADLYALGLVAYELLAGKSPFAGRTPQALLAAQISEMPAPPAAIRPGVPPRLSDVVMQLLAKSPTDRPATAGAALALLDGQAEVPSGRGSGSPSRLKYAGVGIAALLVLAVAGWWAYHLRGDAQGSAQLTSSAPATVGVVPFEQLGAGEDAEYFAAGLTEELIRALGEVPGLQVAARTSSFALEGRGLTLTEIGTALGVSNVVSGRVQRSADHLRVTVQLEDVTSQRTLWSERYDEPVGEVFALQDAIARAIVSRLAGEFAADASDRLASRPTTSLEAYELVLRARLLLRQRGGDQLGDLLQTVQLFDRARILDPNYAGASAGLAEAYTVLAIFGLMPGQEALARARVAAERALAVDSTNVEALTAYGFVLSMVGEYPTAESVLRQAIAFRPSDALAHHYYSLLLLVLGRTEEARASNARARVLDPLSLPAHATYGTLGIMAGDLAAARSALERALVLDHRFPLAAYILALVEMAEQRPDRAIPLLEGTIGGGAGFPGVLGALAAAYRASGRRAAADSLIAALQAREDDGRRAWNLAIVHATAGDLDSAFAFAEASARDVPTVIEMRSNPLLEAFRRDPRYRALLARGGLQP